MVRYRFKREQIALLVIMVLKRAARVRVQAAMNGVISTGLCPADRYAFTNTNCVSLGVTDFVKQTSK